MKEKNKLTFMIARHGQRADGFDVGRWWIKTDPPPSCPWNPPLTELGERMAVGLGARMHGIISDKMKISQKKGTKDAPKSEQSELSCKPAVICFCSPLKRCVTTAACAIEKMKELDPSHMLGYDELELKIEDGVVEFLEGDWYSLWKCNRNDHQFAKTNVATLFPKRDEIRDEASKHCVFVVTIFS